MKAEKIEQLSVHNEERQILWRALRDRAQAEQSYAALELPEMAVDPEVLALLVLGLGISDLEAKADG